MFIILEEESVRHPIPCMAIQVVSVFAPRHKHIVQAVVFAEPSVLSHRFLGQNLTIVSHPQGSIHRTSKRKAINHLVDAVVHVELTNIDNVYGEVELTDIDQSSTYCT